MRRGAGDRGSSEARLFPQAFLVADATIGLKVIQGSAARRGSIVAAGD
jgi:hypothetical protein